MTVAELRLALADYPPEAEVEVICSPEYVPFVDGVASAAEAVAHYRTLKAGETHLTRLQAMLVDPEHTVYLLVCSYA